MIHRNGVQNGVAPPPPQVERSLPADINAERATLGSILLERDAIVPVAAALTPEMFYMQKHAWVYEAVLACYNQRVPPDLATVADELRRQDRLDGIGGLAYLSELSAEVPTAMHVEYYAQIVSDAALRRQLIQAGGKITALAYEEARPFDDVLGDAEQTLFAVSQRQAGEGFVSATQAALDFHDFCVGAEEAQRVPTGLIDLDSRLNGGFRDDHLVLIGGRPGMGKSALAQTILYHLAVQQRQPVGLVSLEMTRHEIFERWIAMHTGVDTNAVARAIREGHAPCIEALGIISDAPIYIDDGTDITAANLRSRARRLASTVPLRLLVVDYVQLMIEYGRSDDVSQLSYLSRQLKLLAREIGCPVVALSQLSRAPENRVASWRPRLADLRGSGSLEQDANTVLLLYREELYEKDTDKRGIAEIDVAKQRGGETGSVALRFAEATTRFCNLAGQGERGRAC